MSASRLPPLWYAKHKQTVTIHNACKGSSAIEAAKKQTIPSLFNESTLWFTFANFVLQGRSLSFTGYQIAHALWG